MRVDLLDPPAYSPPYDAALAAALARAGAQVRLLTSPFAYGDVPVPEGYIRRSASLAALWARRAHVCAP